MTRLSLAAAALLLAACQSVPSPQSVAPAPAAAPTDSVTVAYEVTKSCDAGRAIYVFDGYKQGGIAVVENAAECVEVLS